MDAIERFIALADLSHLMCELRHHESQPAEPAIGYINVDFGQKTGEITYEKHHTLRIAICDTCYQSLIGGEWAILYCIGCCASRWIPKLYAPMEITWQIKPTKYCPECHLPKT